MRKNKVLCAAMASAMSLSLLAGCGGNSASTAASASAAAGSSDTTAAADADTEEGKVLNIWCWNDEFQSRFNDYYPGVKEVAADKSTTTLNNGITVKWTINPPTDNNYQNKLDEALLKQDSAAADDKIDIFLVEADYALKYVDSDYTLDVKNDVGLTDDDLKDQYQYTKDIVSVDGVQKGTSWQATPGLFAYRRSIAKDVLGTDDPAEVQSALSDWDKFNTVAEEAAAKGYKMLSGYDDAFQITKDTQDYTNCQSAMQSLATDPTYGSDFLGGQNHIALFSEVAPTIDMSNAGPYDQGCNETIQNCFHDYFNGSIDFDTAKANFEAQIQLPPQ